MSVKLSPEDRPRILDILKGGNKIEAVKLVREISGLGLKESKDFVEALVDDHNKELPEIQQIKKSGCLIIILVGLISFCGAVGYKVLS
jgi:hypothetical protein